MRSRSLRKERRMKRNNIIIGIILLVLMVGSMLAVTIGNSSDANLVYGDYVFKIEDVEGGQMATTKVNGQKYYFYSLPSDALALFQNQTAVRDISFAQTIILVKEPLNLGSQASSDHVVFDQLALDLGALSEKTIITGISKEDEFSQKLVYTCNDASDTTAVIMLQNGTYSSTNISPISDNCYGLKSDSMGILILRDYLVYRSLGIIQ